MKRIKNPWEGKENYFCFGCCPDNPSGVHMKFYANGNEVVSVWLPQPQFQGWIDTMHGGIQAVLLDEICAWAVMLKMNTTGVTAEMKTRYRHHISTNDRYLLIRAHVAEVRRKIATVEATISDSSGQLCAQSTCTYFTFTDEKSKEMGYKGLQMEEKEIELADLIKDL